MKRFLPARKLSQAEKRLIPGAFLLLLWAKCVVALLPAGRYLPAPLSEVPPPAGISESQKNYAAMVCGVIEGLSRRLPWRSTCLVQALAGNRMLTRRGIPAVIHLGISKHPENGKLGAHAWLSAGETVLLGGRNLHQYREVARLSGA